MVSDGILLHFEIPCVAGDFISIQVRIQMCLMNWWGSLPGDYLDGPVLMRFSFSPFPFVFVFVVVAGRY